MNTPQSLTPEQVHVLDTWYNIDGNNIPLLLHSIAKLSLITHIDDRYYLSPDEAKSLLTLCDVLKHLTTTPEV